MPIYAFACTACGHHFDRLQKLSDPDPAACPACSAAAVRRQVTAPSFRLSGSGWYETDFKKAGDKKHNLAGDGGKATGEGKAGGGSEAKPADSKPADGKPATGTDHKPATKTDSKPAAAPAAAKPAAGDR